MQLHRVPLVAQPPPELSSDRFRPGRRADELITYEFNTGMSQ